MLKEQSALLQQWSGKTALTLADLVRLDELEWLLSGSDNRRTYAHIVVDEAQDLTPMQARALARRCPSGSMTILGDLAQAAGPHEYHSWRELAGLLTGGSAWTAEVLQTGFRLPPEVTDFVEPLAQAAAPRVPVARSIRPTRGQDVHVESVDSMEHLAEAAAGRIAEIVVAHDGRSAAVIAAADKDLRDVIRAELDKIDAAAVPVLEPYGEGAASSFLHPSWWEPAEGCDR